MAPTSTAVFRAVADFKSLNRNVKEARREIAALKRETSDTSSFKSFDAALARTAEAQNRLRVDTTKLVKSRRDLATAEKSLTGSIERTTKARKDSAGSARAYEKSLTLTDRAVRRLHDAQQKARRSTTSLVAARDKASTSIGSAVSRVTDLAKAETDAVSASRKHTDALKRERSAVEGKLGVLTKMSAYLADLADNEIHASDGADRHSSALGRESASLSAAAQAMRGHSTAAAGVVSSSNNATNATTRLNQSVGKTGPGATSSRSGLSGLSSTLRSYSQSANNAGGSSLRLRTQLLMLLLPAVPAAFTVLVGSISALIGALTGVLGAAGPAAGAIAAIGPAALTAAAAVGTAILAFRGIGDALKAQKAAAQESARESANAVVQEKQAAAARVAAARRILDAKDRLRDAERAQARAAAESARQIEDAERDLIRSHDDVRRALEDLHAERRQAVRDLLDLKNAAIDATLSEEAAEIALIEAKQEQVRVNMDRRSSDLDVRKASLQVAEAEQRLVEAQQRKTRTQEELNESTKQGVDGAPNVVAASERVTAAREREQEAERALSDTKREAAERQVTADESVIAAQRDLQAALEASTESVEKQSAAQSKLAETMAKLSPAGKAFVAYLMSLTPLMDKLSMAAQDALFPGLMQAMQIVMPMINTVAIPTVQAFGKVLGDLAVTGAERMKGLEQNFLSFGTGDGPKLMDKFGNTLINLAEALWHVFEAALPLTQWLADLALRLSEYWKNTARAAKESGRLAEFFEKVRETLTLLGHILRNVGGILKSVFSAAAPMGKRLLETFRDVTDETNKYLKSAEGTAKIKKYFDDMEPSIRIIFRLLTKIAGAFLGLGASKTTYNLLKRIEDVLVPAIERFGKAMSYVADKVGQKFIDFVSKVLDIITKLVEAGGGGGFMAFVTVLDTFANVLLFILNIPGMAQLGSWLLAIAGGLLAIKAIGKIPGIGAIGRGLNTLAGGAAAAAAGKAAPTKQAPATFTKGLAGGVGGATAAPRTGTAAVGAAIGRGARSAVGAVGLGGYLARPPAAAPVAAPVGGTYRPQPMPRTEPRPAGPVVVNSKAPVTVKSPAAPKLQTPPPGSYAGFADDKPAPGLARQMGGAAASVAGAVGGSMAGSAIGGKLGGDTGAMIGSVAGGLAGSFAPDLLAAGFKNLQPLLSSTKSGIASVVTSVGEMVTKANLMKVATQAWAAVQWVLNAAMRANPIGIVITIIGLLVAAFIYAWNNSETFRNIVMGALQAVGDFCVWVWDTLLKPVFDGFLWLMTKVGEGAMWLWHNAIKPAFDGIGAVISWIWNNLIKPAWDAQLAHFKMLGDAAMWLWRNIIQPAFDGIGWVIKGVWDNVIKPVWDAIMVGLGWLGDGFSLAVKTIGDIWHGLKRLLAIPVNFMIGTVWNNGIRKAWNLVADLLPGIEPVGPLPLVPEFAKGGQVPGSGNKDTVPALLTPGEYVISKPVVDRWGIDNIHAAHLAAKSGGTFRGLEGMFSGEDPQGFKRVGYAAGGPVQAGIDFAKQQHGKPYVWGGVGPGGMDCSGFMSAITNVLRGKYPFSRVGTTGSAPWSGFVNGLNSSFGIGYFKGNPGHMAGTIGGNNVESGGSPSMMKFVQNAAGADHRQFTGKMSLPEVGGQFASGGEGGGGFNPLPGMIRDIFEKWTNAVISRMPQPPPKFMGVPREAAIKIRDTALNYFLGQAGPEGGGDYGTGPVIDQVRGVASRYNWGIGPEWDAIYKLVQKESSWNPNAANPTSSARGLFQKMTSIHGPIEATAAGQAEWGLRYIQGRYGTPSKAWAFHLGNNYYREGGPVLPVLHRALGGPVFGKGGRDSVPALLTPGEFVISKKAAMSLGAERLAALNSAGGFHAADMFAPLGATSVPQYALGGAVTAAFNSALSSRGGDSYSKSTVHGGSTSDKAITINTNVYNPTAEPASDSVASRMRTLSQMGAFS